MKTTFNWFGKFLQRFGMSEDVAIMRDAIDAVLAGSKPWEAAGFKDVITVSPFTEREKRALKRYLVLVISEHKRDILRRELHKVLIGAADESLARVAYRISENDRVEKLNPKAASMATGTAQATGIAQAVFNDAAMKQSFLQHSSARMLQHEWEKQAKMAADMYGQQNAASYNDVFGKT